jgi:hypothetical protein
MTLDPSTAQGFRVPLLRLSNSLTRLLLRRTAAQLLWELQFNLERRARTNNTAESDGAVPDEGRSPHDGIIHQLVFKNATAYHAADYRLAADRWAGPNVCSGKRGSLSNGAASTTYSIVIHASAYSAAGSTALHPCELGLTAIDASANKSGWCMGYFRSEQAIARTWLSQIGN